MPRTKRSYTKRSAFWGISKPTQPTENIPVQEEPKVEEPQQVNPTGLGIPKEIAQKTVENLTLKELFGIVETLAKIGLKVQA